MSILENITFLRGLPKITETAGLHLSPLALKGGIRTPLATHTDLIEHTDFGSNPGNLRMLSFVPEDLSGKGALVVVLHGCTQTAAGYDTGAGWSTLAKRYGFSLLMPEQKSANNANGCFNWFQPEDTTRDHGEVLSIRQMIAHMCKHHRIDPRKIFVTGLSAGGAMTSAMLATYPEVFAGGAIIAGLPYGIASNLQQALSSMFRSPLHPSAELGDLVRSASPHRGPWPRVSVWHGDVDRTVSPANAGEIVKQWTDVHGLQISSASADTVNGYPHQVWRNARGAAAIESYTISGMSHGTPLAAGPDADQCGAAGAFLLEVGISSSFHIATFFGLVGKPRDMPVHSEMTQFMTLGQPLPRQTEIVPRVEVLQRLNPKRTGSSRIDIGEVITKALTAAGLMK